MTTIELALEDHSLAAVLARRARRKAVAFMVALAVAMTVAAVAGGGRVALLGLGADVTSGIVYAAPVWLTCAIAAVVCLGGAFVASRCDASRSGRRNVTALVVLATIVSAVGCIAWAARSGQASLAGILALTVGGGIPIMLGSTSGVLAERGGTFNIAIEAQLLAGAFAGAVAGSLSHSVWAGLVVAVVAGLLVGMLLGLLTVRFRVSQVVAGMILISLVTGLTGYLTEQLLNVDPTTLNSPPTFGTVAIPLLDTLPVIGPALFDQSPMFYLAVLVVVVVEFVLRRTRLGLRLRAVGENPAAATSSGIDARRLRFWSVACAGAVGGAGGAFFTLGSSGQFVAGISSGLGYVALAAVILGSWRVPQAAAAALLFGFAGSITTTFGLLKVDIPASLLLMTPYVVTILVVAGVVAVGKGPAAAGRNIED